MNHLFRIIIADDHQLLIEGLMTVIKEMEEIEVLTSVNNGVDLMTEVEIHHPDLVILDLNMPGPDGLSVLKDLKKFFAQVKVFVLTNYNQPELISQVKKLGADGFMVKNSSSSELKKTLRTILAGGNSFPVEQTDEINFNSIFFDDFLKKHNLTKREVGIIKMICNEMSSKEIASTLFLSELTIKTHRRNIMRKLELKSVAGLMNFAKENNIM